MWYCQAFDDYCHGRRECIREGRTNEFEVGEFMERGPPVILTRRGDLPEDFPILEGRHRQRLPLLRGRSDRDRGCGKVSDVDSWLVPWRPGLESNMVITVRPGTRIVLNVSGWPTMQDNSGFERTGVSNRLDRLRRAAGFLQAAPGAFAAESSIGRAYERLDALWRREELGDADPTGDLLLSQARRLQKTLADLAARPRTVLRTEHRDLKLLKVRRTDSKTNRWLSSQPGRNTAERAGSKQRIRAPKRIATANTLENGVLFAFARLTVREVESWFDGHGRDSQHKSMIMSHQLRARKVMRILGSMRVQEAKPTVRPNFPLRFDSRYRGIWRAWHELLQRRSANELEWMWQHRTFAELRMIRAAMKLVWAMSELGGGILAQSPILASRDNPDQGCYLETQDFGATFGIPDDFAGMTVRAAEFRVPQGGDSPAAMAVFGDKVELSWDGRVPWLDNGWDESIEEWADEAALEWIAS